MCVWSKPIIWVIFKGGVIVKLKKTLNLNFKIFDNLFGRNNLFFPRDDKYCALSPLYWLYE